MKHKLEEIEISTHAGTHVVSGYKFKRLAVTESNSGWAITHIASGNKMGRAWPLNAKSKLLKVVEKADKSKHLMIFDKLKFGKNQSKTNKTQRREFGTELITLLIEEDLLKVSDILAEP